MSKEKFREAAKDLAEDSVDLIRIIVEKHNAAILEEMHEQLKKRDSEIEKLKSVVSKITGWSMADLGQEAVESLLNELHS